MDWTKNFNTKLMQKKIIKRTVFELINSNFLDSLEKFLRQILKEGQKESNNNKKGNSHVLHREWYIFLYRSTVGKLPTYYEIILLNRINIIKEII